MAVTIYYESDCKPEVIQNMKVAVIGTAARVMRTHSTSWTPAATCASVCVRARAGWAKAEEAGLKVMSMDDAAEEADLIMILTPDETQPKVYEDHIKAHLKPGNTLAFAHGFNIHFGYIVPPEDVNVIMCAPKGPGHIVRRQFTEGSGVPDLALRGAGCDRQRVGHRARVLLGRGRRPLGHHQGHL